MLQQKLNSYRPQNITLFLHLQCTKKVVSDSPGLVDFAIWLVNSVVNLPDGQVMFFEQVELQKNYEIKSIWDQLK